MFPNSHSLEESGADSSEGWCVRVNKSVQSYRDAEQALVHTLTYACSKIYELDQGSIEQLDTRLRKTNWNVFKRILQHLYAQYVEQVNITWVQEFIREEDRNFGYSDHHYEFQRMLKSACEAHGDALFDEGELKGYLEAILLGPDKEEYTKWYLSVQTDGDAEEAYKQRQDYLHSHQMRPFSKVLFGKYKERYEDLVSNTEKPITDDDYYPTPMKGGTVHSRSPISVESMNSMSDPDLHKDLNEWNAPQHIYSTHDEPVDIDFGSLSGTFKAHFIDIISKSTVRIQWWMENAKLLNRPLYCGAIVGAITEIVAKGEHDNIEEYFNFCDWVLTHPDTKDQHFYGKEREDADPVKQSWSSSRGAVRMFAAKCVSIDTGLPQKWKERVFGIFMEICTSKDALLEEKDKSTHNRNAHNLIGTAINRTRSQALEDLFDYANWVRKAAGTNCDVPEVTKLLDRRFAGTPELTDPERVLLARNFWNLRWLNSELAVGRIPNLFPRKDRDLWSACFSAYLTHGNRYLITYESLKAEYLHAFEHVEIEDKNDENSDRNDRYLINKWMGYYLLMFYLYGKIELEANEGLYLKRFYDATAAKKEMWGHLFNQLGHWLSGWEEDVDKAVVKRVKLFFDWRFSQSQPKELSEFLFWLDGACLEHEWRLNAFLRTLPFADSDDVKSSMLTDKLNKHFLDDYPDLTVECFTEVTKAAQGKAYFYAGKEAAPILKVGLASENPKTKALVEEARLNLLNAGRQEYLHI